MDHDEQCRQQDRELSALKEQFRGAAKDLDMVVERIQKLVDQYHEQSVAIAKIDATLVRGCQEIHDIKGILENKVPTREEFLTVRNQLWSGIGVFVMAVLGALATWVIRGGLR